MRRLATIALLLLAVSVTVVATAGAEDSRTYQAKLFNAFGLVEGSELRVAGVKAGTVTDLDITPEKTALVSFEVGPEFPEFKADASCSSEPQSLIAEYFLDCQPGSAAEPLAAPIEPAANRTTVQQDLVQNTLREPFKQRLALLINEFGTALVGNSENLNAAIRSGAPALREFRKVLKILGRQNTIIAGLNSDADTIFARLTERREEVVRFIGEAEDTARVSAERREDLARDFDLLDDFLVELGPVMTELGNLAREQTPLLTDLRAAAPGLNKLGTNLPRFNDGARVSLNALGRASLVGDRALTKGRDEINQLDIASQKAPAATREIAKFLRSIDDPRNAVEESCLARRDLREQPGEADRRVALLEQKLDTNLTGDRSCDPTSPGGSGNPGYTGIEGLLNYGYIQTLSLNLYDFVGHGLGVAVVGAPEISGDCGFFSAGPDWPAKGGGRTRDPVQADHCVGILGDVQPGITPGTFDPATGLTGNLPPYDNSVCPTTSTHPTICNPAVSTHSAAAGTRAAPPITSPPPPEKIDDVAKEIEETGKLPSASDLREQLGLPPGALIPPSILDQLGLGGLAPGQLKPPATPAPPPPQSPGGGLPTSPLLDYLLGP
jgi:ABC-type transporter Mla subunit MlaD